MLLKLNIKIILTTTYEPSIIQKIILSYPTTRQSKFEAAPKSPSVDTTSQQITPYVQILKSSLENN